MNSSTRVILNSFVLYGRLIVTTLIKLVITKLLICHLGLESFGLYNLLAGIVVMLAFFKATLASTSQRFLSVSMGKNNIEGTKEIYYFLYVIHIIMALVIFILIDIVGVVLVQNVLNIPEGQENTAIVLIHTMAISTSITILSVPNDALLISRENLFVLSLILIIESVLNLVAAYSLQWFHTESRLTIYAIMVVVYMLFTFVLRHIYVRKYQETHVSIHRIKDWTIIKEISNF